MSRSSEKVKRWRQNSKVRMLIAMGGQCVCCEYDRCDDALEFHHLDSEEKDFGMGAIRANPKSWPDIVDELRKCVLVCALCHREVHAGIREIPDSAARFNETCVDYHSPLFVGLMDTCPVCRGPKDTTNATCSSACAAQYRGKTRKGKIDWDAVDLAEELKTKSFDDLAKELGCSNAAVWKRATKLGIHQRLASIWSGHDLEALMHTNSMTAISRIVGCSEMSVRKRVRKVGLTHLIRYKNEKATQ